MRALCLLPLAFACSPDATREPWHGDDDGTPYLGDDLDARFPLRTMLYDEPGDARLRHDSAPLPPVDARWRSRAPLRVVEEADALRVAWEGHGVQLLLWLDRADLVDVVAYPSVGVGRPDTPPDTPGAGQVRIPAGTLVDLAWVEDDHTFVSWEAWANHSGARVTAWVHLGDVDQVWETTPAPMAHTSRHANLQGAILDRPAGVPLAEPVDPAGLIVERTGEAESGWWPVAWSNGLTRVDGWAYEEDLAWLEPTSVGRGGAGSSRCMGSLFLPGVVDRVPVGTLLRTDRDGPVVARATRTHIVPGFDQDGGWLQVHTPWGEAELFADPLDRPVTR